MKFLASLSWRRSAVMATILRPVALATSLAAASSGSLRRAQIAMSTPSFARASAIPLPMPSLPPVISAVLPLSLRSIALSRFLMWLVREPAARFRGRKQIRQCRVEHRRLFRRNIVARARNHQETRRRRRALEKHAAVDAGFIFVADNDQQRHGKLLQHSLHLPQRRKLELEIEHGMRVAFGGMVREHAREFGVAARVLVLLRLAHRRVGIFRRSSRDPFLGKHLAD